MHRFLYIVLFTLCTGPLVADGTIQSLQLLIDQELYDQAAQRGERLLEAHAGNPEIEFLTAYAYQMNRHTRKAARLYKNLIRQHPELPEPKNNLAMIYLSDGAYDEASELLVKAINTHPSYATAYANLGNIYTAIASEAYRRAVSETSEPVSYAINIELTALTRLTALDPDKITSNISESSFNVNPAIASTLTERLQGWAQAWSEKDIDAYFAYYSTEHKLNYATHEDWTENRKHSLMQPGIIKISLSNIQIRALTDNLAIIDFEQSFDSPEYSDRVIKRLGLSRINSQWIIIDEQVLSVL